MAEINIPLPQLQIDFSFALGQIRQICLQEALQKTVAGLDIAQLDRELSEYVPSGSLKAVAQHGLRGELVFPTPYLLQTNPHLLGYYRLLLGFSQKSFYTLKFGLTGYKTMEERGVITKKQQDSLPKLCGALVKSLCQLVEGVGVKRISKKVVDDLTLLTVGPQLRGGANVKKGIKGIVRVFEAIQNIVEHATIKSSESNIKILNASRRIVVIKFAPDPDIVIQEEIAPGNFQNKIAIEVKAGTDFSNIHNRVGEAEKSHQKAKAAGYVECWTVVNVENFNETMAHRESPSTNRFYLLGNLISETSSEYLDFKARILALTGISGR